MSSEGSIEERVKFTGKDYDEAAGLYYFNARWYDAELGQFTTEDPARDGLNWYVYVRNNPLRFVDPTGLILLRTIDGEKQDTVDIAQQSLGGGAIHTDWGYKSTIRNYGCVFIAQVNAANSANDFFGKERIKPSDYNNTATFGDDQLLSIDERNDFQKAATNLETNTYSVSGTESSIEEILRLQNSPDLIASVEARIDGHSVNINRIKTTTDELGNKSSKLEYFQTADYFNYKEYGVDDIDSLRVTYYKREVNDVE